MAKVLQVIDVDSSGHCVRLDDGRIVVTPHGGDHPQVGEEFPEPEDDVALMVEKLKESHRAEVNEAINVIIQQRDRIIDLEQQLEDSKTLVEKLKAEIEEEAGLTPEQRAELQKRLTEEYEKGLANAKTEPQ